MPVLGRFDGYLLIQVGTGRTGWLASELDDGDARSPNGSRERSSHPR
jgi:hypothetical protein